MFFRELPVGHARYYQHAFDPDSNSVLGPWKEDYEPHFRSKRSRAVDMNIKGNRTAKEAVLVNCLDHLYGHSVLKLLNVQRHVDTGDKPVIAIVPSFLEWMVPYEVAETWVVDLRLSEGLGWHESLARSINEESARFTRLWISPALSHPQAEDVSIERFTHVAPFSATRWGSPPTTPVVTFIWRDDRHWLPMAWARREVRALPRILRGAPAHLLDAQLKEIVSFAETLRSQFPDLDFGIVGVAEPVAVPDWINVEMHAQPTPAIEKSWCRRYAKSHVVVGIHGSSMLLPSAHAGSVVELVPEDRWGNIVQDLLVTRLHVKEALFAYRNIPATTDPGSCAAIVTSLLRTHDEAVRNLTAAEIRDDLP